MVKVSILKSYNVKIISQIILPIAMLCGLIYLVFIYHPYENDFVAVSDRVNEVFGVILKDYKDKNDIEIIHEILMDKDFMKYNIVPRFYEMAKYLTIFDFFIINLRGLTPYQEIQVGQIAKVMQAEINRRKTLNQ